MTWFRIDDTWLTHPKVQAAGLKGRALWVAGGLHCAQHLTDGRIDKAVIPMLAVTAGVSAREAKTLVDAGLWHDEGDAYRMHDYHDYQPSRTEHDAKVERRRAASVKGNHERWHVGRDSQDPTCPLCIAEGIPIGSQSDPARDSPRPVPSRPQLLTVVPLLSSTTCDRINDDERGTTAIELIADYRILLAEGRGARIDDPAAYRAATIRNLRADTPTLTAIAAELGPEASPEQIRDRYLEPEPLATYDDLVPGATG